MWWYVAGGLLLLISVVTFLIIRWVKKHSLWIDQDAEYFADWDTTVMRVEDRIIKDDDELFSVTRHTSKQQNKV